MKEEELKTSEEWSKTSDVIVYDPDGWDREHFQYSWFEVLITLDEFNKRVSMSTCMYKME